MATNMQAAKQAPHERAGDPGEAARQRWIRATGTLPDGDVLGGPASFVQSKPAARPAAVPPITQDPPRETATLRRPVPEIERRAPLARQRSSWRLTMYGAVALVAVLAIYLLVSAAVGWARLTMDDLQYGRPRTTQIDAYVGHAGEQNGSPSHFMALNLDRRVVIVELPGGGTQGATTISGPYLFGEDENLTPAQLSVEDLNGDGDPDLLLSVNDEQIAYINEKAQSTFRLMTPEEHLAFVNSAARGGSLATEGTVP